MTTALTKKNRNPTLRAVLLWWLIPTLVAVMVAGLWLSNKQLRNQVDMAYDRSLSGALRSIDHNISTASGGLSMEQPYLLLEFFELTANGHVYYRVATEDGLAEIGSPGLPMPSQTLISGQPRFFYAEYEGERVRVAAMARPMDPPLYNNHGGRVIVQVAETLETRQGFLDQALLRSMSRDLVVVAICVLVVVWGVFMALRPLIRLEEDLDKRPADDLSPIDASQVPGEVQPLVDAINAHIARFTAQVRVQRQFLDDASHQLRTPLSVLRTQTAYALRETDPAEIYSALLGMQEGLDRAVRTTNQMLSLARAKDATLDEDLAFEPVDLADMAHGVVRNLLPAARTRKLDLGLDMPEIPVVAQGAEWLLREALSNILDNAIRYTPESGEITVRVAHQQQGVSVTVEDSGPGMSEADIARAGVRFRRGAAGKNKPGAGLGLAIVETIMVLHGGRLILENRDPGPGLKASMWLAHDAAAHHEKVVF